MPVSSKEFLDIQATIECGFTLKRIRDMTRTDSQTCDRCCKILLDTDFEPKNICVIWNNCEYRILTTLKREQAQRLI